MKTKQLITTILCTGGLALVPFAANATVVATVATGAEGTFSVSNTDLADAATGGTTSFTGTASWGAPGKVIDGGIYNESFIGDANETLAPTAGSTLTLNLAEGNGLGWDISSIVVLTGVHENQLDRSDHGYSILFSTDGTTFGDPIITVSNETMDLEVQMTIADDGVVPALLGSGVKAVRFVFSNPTGSEESMYQEIDVMGVALVPEPSSVMLLAMGGLALLLHRKRS